MTEPERSIPALITQRISERWPSRWQRVLLYYAGYMYRYTEWTLERPLLAFLVALWIMDWLAVAACRLTNWAFSALVYRVVGLFASLTLFLYWAGRLRWRDSARRFWSGRWDLVYDAWEELRERPIVGGASASNRVDNPQYLLTLAEFRIGQARHTASRYAFVTPCNACGCAVLTPYAESTRLEGLNFHHACAQAVLRRFMHARFALLLLQGVLPVELCVCIARCIKRFALMRLKRARVLDTVERVTVG